MKKYIPKSLQATPYLWILGIDLILSAVLYGTLAVIGISEDISLLAALLTLVVGLLVTILIVRYLSFRSKQSYSETPKTASRRELFRSAGALGMITLAGQHLLNDPALHRTEVSSMSVSNSLAELATSLAQAQQWSEAERVAHSIEGAGYRATALLHLVTALAQAQQWSEAERVAHSVEDIEYPLANRAIALSHLVTAFAQTQQC